MRILLLAPHPFYQERGTPIAVDLLLRVLSERGDTVDVLTFPEGADRTYPGVTIRRAARPPLVSGVRPGLSAKKLLCDAFMTTAALDMARRGNYDVVHAVEEAVFMAMLLKTRLGIPYVFDMDSSMPRQIVDRRPSWKFLLPFMSRCERAAARGAAAVVAVCDELEQAARGHGAARTVVLRDISLLDFDQEAGARNLKAELGIRGCCFLYLGNLESYQGIALLLQSFALLHATDPDAGLVVAGGTPQDVEHYRQMSRQLGTAGNAHFIGPQPLRCMRSLFEGADALVSPRIQGGNTPMKIYSYMDSGRPMIATNLPTHTQVLDPSCAILVEPDANSFAAGMRQLARQPELRSRLGYSAREVARRLYSFTAFRETVREFYGSLEEQLGRRTANCAVPPR